MFLGQGKSQRKCTVTKTVLFCRAYETRASMIVEALRTTAQTQIHLLTQTHSHVQWMDDDLQWRTEREGPDNSTHLLGVVSPWRWPLFQTHCWQYTGRLRHGLTAARQCRSLLFLYRAADWRQPPRSRLEQRHSSTTSTWRPLHYILDTTYIHTYIHSIELT